MQNVANQLQQSGASMGAGIQPPQTQSNPQSHPPLQPPNARMPNGMPLQRPPLHYTTNGAMPNGINPVMGGQPTQPGQQQMPGQPGTPMTFIGLGGQPNGHQPPQGGPQQTSNQTMPFNAVLPGAGNQRSLNSQQQPPGQQPPGKGPFTSPPMSHSPQGSAGGSALPPQASHPGQPGQAPMAQMGPSPHITSMTRGMIPPNGAPSTQNGPPTPAFPSGPGAQQGSQGQGPNSAVRPPSRTRPTPSPSLSARQTPGGPGVGPQQAVMAMMAMGGMPNIPGMAGMGVAGMHGAPGPTHENAINQEFMQIPLQSLNALKQELSIGDRDVGTLNIHDKVGF